MDYQGIPKIMEFLETGYRSVHWRIGRLPLLQVCRLLIRYLSHNKPSFAKHPFWRIYGLSAGLFAMHKMLSIDENDNRRNQ